jgi:ABC-type lipoprotein release transport system permease subunit
MEWRTIVGVVGDVRHDGLASTTGPVIYVPVAQTPFTVLDMSLVRELAVRAAMGATQDALQGLILRQTAIVTGIGLLAGLLGMSLLTRLLGTMLYEVSATDPKTLIAAALAVVAVALLAAYVPARRAGRVDPVALLRQE